MRFNPLHAGMLAVLGSLALVPISGRGAERPNILLILSDDHSVPHVGCYGNTDIKTPNLDRFAGQGIRCDRAYVACPQCVPSRAAIMTGRSPVRIQMSRFSSALPAEVVVYPELLRSNGYYAGVCGRTFHLDGGQPIQRVLLPKGEMRPFADRLDYVRSDGQPNAFSELQEFLDQAKDKPWFLQLCFSDPHRPLDRNEYSAAYDASKLKLPAHYPDTPAVRDDFARYYGEITRLDELFGKIMAELDRRGLAANTLVAFMGDNGCSQFRGKGTLYEYGIHVPLLLRWPARIKPGSSTDELISGEDLAPTFLAAAGVTPPKEMTGISFLPLLCGEASEGRKYVFAERGAHGGASLPTGASSFDLSRVVVTKAYKLIYNALWQLPYQPVDFGGDEFWKELVAMNAAGKLSPELSRVYFSPTRPMFELYDLAKDPREFENLIGKPEVASIEQKLKAELRDWMITERDFLPLPAIEKEKPRGGGGRKGKAARSR